MQLLSMVLISLYSTVVFCPSFSGLQPSKTFSPIPIQLNIYVLCPLHFFDHRYPKPCFPFLRHPLWNSFKNNTDQKEYRKYLSVFAWVVLGSEPLPHILSDEIFFVKTTEQRIRACLDKEERKCPSDANNSLWTDHLSKSKICF